MTVVPDSIEPVEEWRTWKFDGSTLLSHNATEWKPGEAHKAVCRNGQRQEWTIVRGGWSRETAVKRARSQNDHARAMNQFNWGGGAMIAAGNWLSEPSVEPPDGYGYDLQTVTHDAPNATCSCGIYAGHTPADCPSGDILGKVKLWGTVVPGTKGSRAEFAYPSELHVPAKLADHPALLAYGVPIVALTEKQEAALPTGFPRSRMPWGLKAAVAVNLGAGALNMTLLAFREWI